MNKLFYLLKSIGDGGSVTRAYLNYRLKQEVLRGKVIDVGGGNDSDYISFMKKTDDCDFVTFDVKSGAQIDFEKDSLPANDGQYDTVLFLNVMEHIYNYQHICNEVVRITKSGGQMIGFVPFLMWYHPDHSDYFRYTHEALDKILSTEGSQKHVIEVIGDGPFVAAAQMVVQSFPKLLRPFIFLFNYLLDRLYFMLKGSESRTYALGYYFKVSK